MGVAPTILAVVQRGRLGFEALLFMESLRATGCDWPVVLAEPQPGDLWPDDPRVGDDAILLALRGYGAEIRPFVSRHFGTAYPQGNKIEALSVLGDGPFVFFDTDTIFLTSPAQVPLDFERPSASLRREGTWPKGYEGWPGYEAVWRSLYQRFGLDFASSLDLGFGAEDWRRYLYFNAGWFFGASASRFGAEFLRLALDIRDQPPPELTGQKLTPWLDQIALPLVIHQLGGGRDTVPAGLLDGLVSCHYRALPLLCARESEAAVEVLERMREPLLNRWEPFRRMVAAGEGRRVRAMFAGTEGDEAFYRKRLKAEGLWLRE